MCYHVCQAGAISIVAGTRVGQPSFSLCTSDCTMVRIPQGLWFGGRYNETQAHSVSSVSDCQAACLNDRACVQITWAPDHPDKCVMYQSITASWERSGTVSAWVKCLHGATDPEACTGLHPPNKPPPTGNRGAELMRTDFEAPATVSRAVVYLSAVGWAQAYVNGELVAPTEVLNPGRTSFDVRQWYMAHDITAAIRPGAANAIGIVAAAGWQSMPGHTLAAKLLLSVTDGAGKKMVVPTSTKWMTSTDGPIRSANIYQGESYDATMEIPGWASPGFDATAWAAALANAEFADVVATWQPMQPIRALELNSAESITPIKLAHQNETVYVFKFPQNAAGTGALALTGCPKGKVVTLFYSEVLCGYGTTRWSPPCPAGTPPGGGQFGTVDQRNLRGNWATSYTCKGDPTESWTPAFTYTGNPNARTGFKCATFYAAKSF